MRILILVCLILGQLLETELFLPMSLLPLSSAFLQCNWLCRADPSPFLLLSLISVVDVFDIFDREKKSF